MYELFRLKDIGGIMKYRNSIILLSMIVLLTVGIFAFKSYKKASKLNDINLSLTDLKKQHFLSKQQAVLYASSTTDVLQKGKGKSQVIFIDQQGDAHELKLSGLENGSTYFNKQVLFIEDSDHVMLLGKKLKTYNMPSKELRAIQTGFLPKTKQFYSLYNTGFSKKEDYISTIRYGGEEAIHTSQIPYFVSTAGNLSDRLIVVTQDLISGEFALQEVQLKSKAKIKKLLDLPLENPGELDAISPVVVDENNFYFVMSHYQSEDREDLQLIIVNRNTKKVKSIPFIQYRTEHQVENGLPFSFNTSAHVNDGYFYYVNGLGEVYEYRVSSGEMKKVLQLSYEKLSNHRFEQVSFENNQIHHIYSNEKQKFYLETYDLSSKRNINTLEIQNLKTILPLDDENYYLTNIEMLK